MADANDRYEVPRVDGFVASSPVYVIMMAGQAWPQRCASSWNAACAYFDVHGMAYESEPGDEVIEAVSANGQRWTAIRMPIVHYTSSASRLRAGKAFRTALERLTLTDDWREMLGEEE